MLSYRLFLWQKFLASCTTVSGVTLWSLDYTCLKGQVLSSADYLQVDYTRFCFFWIVYYNKRRDRYFVNGRVCANGDLCIKQDFFFCELMKQAFAKMCFAWEYFRCRLGTRYRLRKIFPFSTEICTFRLYTSARLRHGAGAVALLPARCRRRHFTLCESTFCTQAVPTIGIGKRWPVCKRHVGLYTGRGL